VELEEQAGVLLTRRIADLDPRRGIYAARRRSLRLTALHQRFLNALAAMGQRPGCELPAPAS